MYQPIGQYLILFPSDRSREQVTRDKLRNGNVWDVEWTTTGGCPYDEVYRLLLVLLALARIDLDWPNMDHPLPFLQHTTPNLTLLESAGLLINLQ